MTDCCPYGDDKCPILTGPKPDCTYCGSQTLMEATAAQHFGLPKGQPAQFVRNGKLETCQCCDCRAHPATAAEQSER